MMLHAGRLPVVADHCIFNQAFFPKHLIFSHYFRHVFCEAVAFSTLLQKLCKTENITATLVPQRRKGKIEQQSSWQIILISWPSNENIVRLDLQVNYTATVHTAESMRNLAKNTKPIVLR